MAWQRPGSCRPAGAGGWSPGAAVLTPKPQALQAQAGVHGEDSQQAPPTHPLRKVGSPCQPGLSQGCRDNGGTPGVGHLPCLGPWPAPHPARPSTSAHRCQSPPTSAKGPQASPWQCRQGMLTGQPSTHTGSLSRDRQLRASLPQPRWGGPARPSFPPEAERGEHSSLSVLPRSSDLAPSPSQAQTGHLLPLPHCSVPLLG